MLYGITTTMSKSRSRTFSVCLNNQFFYWQCSLSRTDCATPKPQSKPKTMSKGATTGNAVHNASTTAKGVKGKQFFFLPLGFASTRPLHAGPGDSIVCGSHLF